MRGVESICEECIMNRSYCFKGFLIGTAIPAGICAAVGSGRMICVDDDGPGDQGDHALEVL